MQLSTVRQKFCELSGRHDLVTNFAGGVYTDNGADWFLDNGQRYLDRKFQHIKRLAWYKYDLASGSAILEFRYCYAIKEVWAKTSGEERFQLARRDLNWFRGEYGDSIADMDSGTPEDYAELVINLGPDQIALTSTDYTDEFTYDADTIMFTDEGDHILYRGIMVGPKVDQTYTISVLGKFQAPALYPNKADTLKTYWTEHHPDALILAAMYSLEGFYRNREGQRDYAVQIADTLNDIDQDAAEDEAQDVDSMEG